MYPHHTKWPEGAEWAMIDLNGSTYFSSAKPKVTSNFFHIYNEKGKNNFMALADIETIDMADIDWRETVRSKQEQIKIDEEVKGMEFTKDNIPDLLEYLAGYMRENPDVKKGFGLECKKDNNYFKFKAPMIKIITNLECGMKYRVGPDTYTVYGPDGVGVECPAPYREKPESDANYFTIAPSYESGTDHYLWDDDKLDNELFKKGECFKSEKDALATHNARYGIKS